MKVNSIKSYLDGESARIFAEGIIDTIHEPIIVLDSDLRVISVNDSFYEYFNVNPSNTIGNLIYDLDNYQWDIPVLRELLEDILPESSTIKDFEVNNKFPDIGEKTLLLNARWMDIERHAPMILISIQDITDRKKAEQELKKNKERLNVVLDSINDVLYSIDFNWNIIFLNNSPNVKLIAQSYGLEKIDELIGLNFWKLFHNYLGTIVEDNFKEAMEKREIRQFEVFGELTQTWTETTVYPSSEGITVFGRDITERKNAEKALQDSETKQRQQREFLDCLVDYAGSGIAVLQGRDLRFTLVNPAYQAITPHIPMVGKTYREVFPEASDAGAEERIHHVMDTGEPWIIETYHGPIPGKPDARWQGTVVRLPIEDGQEPSIISIVVDVTERWRVEEALRESEERLRFALDTCRIGAWDMEIESQLTIRSPQHDRIYGYDNMLPEWTYEMFLEHVVPEDRGWVDATYQNAIKNQSSWSFEFRIFRADGEIRWISEAGSHKRDKDGNARRVAGIVMDITERKEAEEHAKDLMQNEQQFRRELQTANEELIQAQNELQESINKLEISNKELEQFAYVASHDLQEPLRMVASFNQLLEMKYKDKLDDEATEYINFAVDGAKRMQTLINDLLAFSRVKSDSKEFEVFSLDKVLDEALFNLEIVLEENKSIIHREHLPVINGDYSQMVQVFQNIIGNSLKYRSEKRPEIKISSKKEPKQWIISIEDNGIGMSPEFSDKIFEIFRRLHTKDEYEGTGIGLAITKRIVERHGGRIWVESEEGKGSTLYFTIPKQKIDAITK